MSYENVRPHAPNDQLSPPAGRRPVSAHLSCPIVIELFALPDILVHVYHLSQSDQAVQLDPDEHAAEHAKDETGQRPGEKVRSDDPGVLVRPVGGDEEGDEDESDPDGYHGEEADPELGLIQADCMDRATRGVCVRGLGLGSVPTRFKKHTRILTHLVHLDCERR